MLAREREISAAVAISWKPVYGANASFHSQDKKENENHRFCEGTG